MFAADSGFLRSLPFYRNLRYPANIQKSCHVARFLNCFSLIYDNLVEKNDFWQFLSIFAELWNSKTYYIT